MFKSATTLAVLSGSASALAAPSTKIKTRFNHGIDGLVARAKATPVAAGYVASAAAVSGDWATYTYHDSCSSTSGTPLASEGYLMGYCSYREASLTVPAYYAVYTCTQDDATNNIVVSSTRYTDAACTSGADVQSSVNIPTTCSSGETYACTLGTMPYNSIRSDYSNAVSVLGYDSKSNCDSKSAEVYYEGAQGCGNDFEYFGKDGLTLYSNADCTGSVQYYVDYDDALTATCSMSDDDGDDDDGDLVYDNIYQEFSWSNDGSDDDVCFHVDSKIDYKGVEYTYEELKAGKEPECTVPHSPSSKGVAISTSCDKTVRVTDTHLMATTKGFQLAYSLKAGDVLFGDYSKDMCVVKSVEKEKTTQQYFGLNCVHSEVLASGLRASTFGDFHTLPSWYMTYVGGLVGSETASSLGGVIAEWYFQK